MPLVTLCTKNMVPMGGQPFSFHVQHGFLTPVHFLLVPLLSHAAVDLSLFHVYNPRKPRINASVPICVYGDTIVCCEMRRKWER